MRRRKPTPADYELSTSFDFATFDQLENRVWENLERHRFVFFLMLSVIFNSICSIIYIINIEHKAITVEYFLQTLFWSALITTITAYPLIAVWFVSVWLHKELFYNRIVPAEFRRQSEWVSAYRKRLAAYRQDLADWNYLNLETGHGFWKDLRGAAFEDALARLFQRRGVSVEKTRTTGDGGIDLVLRSGSDLIFVQCKGYAKPVPVAPIREIAGVCSRSHAIPVVAAVNGFTKGAIECARDLNVTLVDTPEIVRMAALDHLDKSSLRAVSSST